MSQLNPAAVAARSTLYPKLAQAQWAPCGDGCIPSRFHVDDANRAARCGLLDLTALVRTGFRGARAGEHLEAAGFPLPARPNQAALSATGELVLRLSQNEFWLLGSLEDKGQRLTGLATGPHPEVGCYPLFCQDSHGWLALSGACAAGVMAKLCALEMSAAAFPECAVAQTSVARTNAVVIRHRIGEIPLFSLLFDVASLPYMWDLLLDAIQEFEGTPVGCAALERC